MGHMVCIRATSGQLSLVLLLWFDVVVAQPRLREKHDVHLGCSLLFCFMVDANTMTTRGNFIPLS